MQTTADKIANEFNNDGQVFDGPNGSFDSVCEGEASEVDQNWGRETTRYTFKDGSVLTASGGGWDFGYPDCHCWRGSWLHENHHLEECPEKQEDGQS
jgi:hypothetical protein